MSCALPSTSTLFRQSPAQRRPGYASRIASTAFHTMSDRNRFAPSAAQLSVPLARFALFVVYAWFGVLKVVGQSPAQELVRALHGATIRFLDFDRFFVAFGLFEVLVGVLFLVPAATRAALTLLALHLLTTILPLFVLRDVAWQQFLVPTLEGQYMIKNLLIIAAAVTIAGERTRSKAHRPSTEGATWRWSAPDELLQATQEVARPRP
jgi:uncharacterized membrane protein YkgB